MQYNSKYERMEVKNMKKLKNSKNYSRETFEGN